MAEITRRQFLAISTRLMIWASGLLGLAGVVRFLNYRPPPPPPRRFMIGSPTSYPLGSRTLLADIPALLIHSEDGFSALSLVCTHLGCTVEQSLGAFLCPCHGSRYDRDGRVTKGPAGADLAVLQVEVDEDGNLVVVKG